MSHCSGFARVAALMMLVGWFGVGANAMPPHPDAVKKWQEEGVLEQKMAILEKFDAPNRLTSEQIVERMRQNLASSAALGAEADEVDTVFVCVLLVDFPDFHWNDTYYAPGNLHANGQVQPYQFDSLMFTRQGVDELYNPSGSMTEFYLENSYGKYFIHGDVKGWYTVDRNYSYYVGTDDGNTNGPALVADAVRAADPDVDFSLYANGGTSLPGLIVVHAGPGAEQGAYGIWSHRFHTSADADGVHISNYTLNPEEDFYTARISNVGVFCHEWGHVLGLPDWYDTDYEPASSDGLGQWDVMAGGSWNDSGRHPAHFSAMSKFMINGSHQFLTPTFLTTNMTHAEIPMAELNPVAYVMKDQFDDEHPGTGDWFIVENRQLYSFDQGLPGSGLLIYHFDPTASDNGDPNHYRLALEQADGLNQLAWTVNNEGDGGDPFPGSTDNRAFHDFSVPSAYSNSGLSTQVAVWDITDSDSLMYADLDVMYSRPWLVPGDDSLMMYDSGPYGSGDGDGIFEQGETIAVKVEFLNKMHISYLPSVHMTCSNPNVVMVSDEQSMGTALNPLQTSENINMLLFRIPDDFRSTRATLTFTVTSYDAYMNPTRTYQTTKTYTVTLGKPQVLLVDDDEGELNETEYIKALDRLGVPYDVWDKSLQASPAYEDLARYENIFWMTGSYYPPSYYGGVLSSSDISALAAYLDAGGNLLLGSYTSASHLHATDSAFMANYLHAHFVGTRGGWRMRGLDGTAVGNGYKYITTPGSFTENIELIEPINGGESEFYVIGSTSSHCGVTYHGDYRTVFITMEPEFFSDEGTDYMPKDTLIMRSLDFFFRGSATAVDDRTDDLLPNGFALEQNYPNPFNPTTTISYSLAAGRQMTNLSVFNVLGQKVVTLVNEIQGPGDYTVNWNGTSTSGTRVSSGIYFYRLTHGEDIRTKKMVLLK